MQPEQRCSLVLERVRLMSHHVTWQRLIYKIQQKILIRHQPAYQATQQALLNSLHGDLAENVFLWTLLFSPSCAELTIQDGKKKKKKSKLQSQPKPSLSALSRCSCSCIASPLPRFDVAPRQIKGYIFVGPADALCSAYSSSLLSLFFTH